MLTQAPAEDDLVKRLFGESGPDWAHIAVHFAPISRGLRRNQKTGSIETIAESRTIVDLK
jgi:hypothetical protein